MHPEICDRSPTGFTTAPQSNAATTRTIFTDPDARSAATSAHAAMYPPLSNPHAMPTPLPRSGFFPHPNFSAAVSSTARSRASSMFFSRKASVSIDTSRASSSTCISRAKLFAVAASPR